MNSNAPGSPDDSHSPQQQSPQHQQQQQRQQQQQQQQQQQLQHPQQQQQLRSSQHQLLPPYDFFGYPAEAGGALPPPPPEQHYRGFPFPPPPLGFPPPLPYPYPPPPPPHMMPRSMRGVERYRPDFFHRPRGLPYGLPPPPPHPYYFPGRLHPYAIPYPPALPPMHQSARRATKKPHVPRPPNAFMLFRSEFLRKTQHVEKRQQHLSRMAGEEWHRISDAERASWMERAAEKAAEHSVAHPNYKFAPAPRERVPPMDRPRVERRGKRRARDDDDDDDEYIQSPSKRRRRASSEESSGSLLAFSPSPVASSSKPPSSSYPTSSAGPSTQLPTLRPTLPPAPPLMIDPPKPPPALPPMLGPSMPMHRVDLSVPYHHSMPPAMLARRPSTATGVRPAPEKKADETVERPASATDFDSMTRRQSLQDRSFGFPMGGDFAQGSGLSFLDPWGPGAYGFGGSGGGIGPDSMLDNPEFDTTFSLSFDPPYTWNGDASGTQPPYLPEPPAE